MTWLDDSVNLLSLIGAAAILILTVFVSGKYIRMMKTAKSEGELADENWDGIGEYKNELPAGWAYSFLGTIIWGLWYFFAGYPLNAYSQIGEYNEEVKTHAAAFEKTWENPTDEDLMGMGEGVFLVQCSPCHGIDATGIEGKAQDLTKRFTKDQVLYVIENGQDALKYDMGPMPAGMAFGEGAQKIAEYVANGMKGEQPVEFATCAGCHGADGQGMDGMAPSLVAYDESVMKHVLENGKASSIGIMPSFKGRLTPVQEKAVSAYVASLSK
jgi:cytochrome c oxidase cbb3-type subunit 3